MQSTFQPTQSYQPHAAAPVRSSLGLNAAATKQAWKGFAYSVFALVFGVVLTLLGLVTGFLVIPGVILTLLGLVLIPFTFIGLFDPTKHGTLRALGADSGSRRRMLDYADGDASSPETWRLPAGAGALYVTPSFVIHVGGSVDVVRREDVVWVWEKTERSGRIFKTYKPFVCFKTRQGHKVEVATVGHEGAQIVHALARAIPYAYMGYSPSLEGSSPARLAREVDARRAAVGCAGM